MLKRSEEEFADLTDINDFINAVMAMEFDDEGTGCGMDDQLVGATSNMARVSRTYKNDGVEQTETPEQVEARLEFVQSVSAAIEGDAFDTDIFEQQVENATAKVEAGYLDDWAGIKALMVAHRVLRDRGVEGGALSRIEVLQTSDEGVHGHVEEAIVVVKPKDVTVDQTALANETGRQVFTYNHAVSYDIARATTADLNDIEAAQKPMQQGVTTANVAGAFQLTNGTQRAIIYS